LANPTYHAPELPKFAGNPCLESLPLINSREKASEVLTKLPPYDEEMRLAEAHLRQHMVMDILHFFQPLSTQLKLEGMISRAIRDGYIDRNPLDLAHSDNLKIRAEHFKTHPYVGECASTNSSGFLICGMSGIGKSTSLARILSLYPQLIIHRNYRGKRFTRVQIVMTILECPKDGSTKALCEDFFKTIDYLMGGKPHYSKKYGKKAENTNNMTHSIAHLAIKHHLGILVIDEIQYLNVAKSGGADEMLNFFVKLVNTIGIPVVLVGTYEAAPLLTSTFRLARRNSGQGDLIWEPLPFSSDPRSNWQLYAETLWYYQYVRTPSPLTEQLSKALHDISFGIPDIANKIYLATQIRAIETGEEVITEGMLRSVYRDDFRLISDIIETLKTGRPELLQRFKDVHCPPIILAQISDSQGNGNASRQSTKTGADNTGNSQKTVPKSTQATPTQSTPVTSQSCPPSNQSNKTGEGRRNNRARKADDNFEAGDLRGIIAGAGSSTPKLHPYYALLNAGVIKNPAEFLSTNNQNVNSRRKESA
jgi:hypothetical protein